MIYEVWVIDSAKRGELRKFLKKDFVGTELNCHVRMYKIMTKTPCRGHDLAIMSYRAYEAKEAIAFGDSDKTVWGKVYLRDRKTGNLVPYELSEYRKLINVALRKRDKK